MEPVKKLVLDYSKWHSGGNAECPNKVGKGRVALLNEKGFSCCLGQWIIQLGAPEEMLKDMGEPGELRCVYEPFNKPRAYEYGEICETRNTPLTNACININDDPETTPEEKISLLTLELKKHNIELEVINAPINPS